MSQEVDELEELKRQQAERIAKEMKEMEEEFLRHANPVEFVSYAIYRNRVPKISVVWFPNADEWEPVQ